MTIGAAPRKRRSSRRRSRRRTTANQRLSKALSRVLTPQSCAERTTLLASRWWKFMGFLNPETHRANDSLRTPQRGLPTKSQDVAQASWLWGQRASRPLTSTPQKNVLATDVQDLEFGIFLELVGTARCAVLTGSLISLRPNHASWARVPREGT